MAEVTIRIQGQDIVIPCAPHEQRRIADLAALLESRLAVFAGEPESMRRLVITALMLMDEAQASGAALARARSEIDRLNDLVAEANFAPHDDKLGCVPSFTRRTQGAA